VRLETKIHSDFDLSSLNLPCLIADPTFAKIEIEVYDYDEDGGHDFVRTKHRR